VFDVDLQITFFKLLKARKINSRRKLSECGKVLISRSF
jgi:hypothetical protein